MTGPKPLILLEFNELSPTLMDRFIAEGKLPNFAKLRARSQVCVTETDEVAPNLEPWIQWITVHTGLSYKEHGVFDLGDGHKLNYPRVFELLSEHGYKIFICGSMNAAFRRPPNGYFIPDPWSVGVDPYPKGEFEDFFNYIRLNVQEHTRDKMVVSKSEHLKFLLFMVRHGLSTRTVVAIMKQLAEERSGKFRWKRAMILDRLLWDVFEYYWKKKRPAFSTFFLNSTAHFQHFYWRNMDPNPFKIKPSTEEQAEYENAVLFGYEGMDKIVGRCLDVAGPDTVVILASALSQQPCLIYEDKSGKTFYRPNDPEKFFEYAGIHTPHRFAPVMSEQFHLYFKEEPDAVEAEKLLAAMRVDGRALMMARRDGHEVFAGCTIFQPVDPKATVTNSQGEAKEFGSLLYKADVLKSGMHHPDGILWVGDTSKQPTESRRVSLRSVAPTILAHFGVTKPNFMRADPLPPYAPAAAAEASRVMAATTGV